MLAPSLERPASGRSVDAMLSLAAISKRRDT